uniref:Uncharacterized protein n=1 Tax=Zooxanthella nutricula TaxID=1333877 RepID=A0A6U6L6F3_9DINO
MFAFQWNTCKEAFKDDQEEDDACEIRAIGDDEEEIDSPLISASSLVKNPSNLDIVCPVAECERLKEGSSELPVAFASPPGLLEVAVPQNYKYGDKVLMRGPHGTLLAQLPAEAQPGTTFRYPLRPAPEFNLEVPTGKAYSDSILLRMEDGRDVVVDIPRGAAPGDSIPVSPPCMIIQVPENVSVGQSVQFETNCGWFASVVPDSLQLGRYFAARIPGPECSMPL